jgi:RNA recognition motif-containing protein
LGVKTIYIPRNGRSGRRRGFAVIGFSSSKDLQKVLSSHVELFGSKTWWSTKDNKKVNKRQHSREHKDNYTIESANEISDTMSIATDLSN